MLKIIIDTNVIIAAIHNPVGKPALVLSIALSEMPEMISMYISPEIWGEYLEIFGREKFNYFNKNHVKTLLSQIRQRAILIKPSLAVSAIKIDPADNRFLECALAAEADFLVTGNTKHFPFKKFHRTRIVSPHEFLIIVGEAALLANFPPFPLNFSPCSPSTPLPLILFTTHFL